MCVCGGGGAGAYLGFGTTLGGHRHEFFRVSHLQWKSMGFEKGSVQKTNSELLSVCHGGTLNVSFY